MDSSNPNHNNNNNNQNSSLSLSNGSHIVCEGWLTKSPSEKIWKTKWRRRWFVLKLSGQIPGQYVLEYYTDSSKRKLKGTVDLDQCEQVDAGLQLESRKENFQHMFDVRTSKRTYYLVAKSEIEMNKWVECICSVCGLKIHVDEGQDDRYSPQPSQEFAFSASNNNSINSTNNTITTLAATPTTSFTVISNTTTSTSTSNTTTSTPISSTTTSSATKTNTLTKMKNSDKMNNSKKSSNNNSKSVSNNNNSNITSNTLSNTRASMTHIEGPSGPYIPISECHTGKPINGSLTDIDSVPQIPSKLSRAVSDECYDTPRQLNPQSTDSTDARKGSDNLLDCVPIAPKSVANGKCLRNSVDSSLVNPPKVNWSTYPTDSYDSLTFNPNDMTRTSVRSCNASVDVTTRHCSVNDPGVDPQGCLPLALNRDSILSSDSSAQSQPPPRPPKPPSLRKSKVKSESCASLPNVTQLYDVPITAVEHHLKGDDNCSPTFKSSFGPQSDSSPKSPDELYDFPRMNAHSEVMSADDCTDGTLINATVPIGLDGSKLRANSKKNSYTNAPPGYFINKETVFNYEYRPTLGSSADDHSNAFSNNCDLTQADRSPLTPNSYSNLQISSSLPNSLIAPAVNRDLKPRRKGSDSDASNTALPSPTTKTATIQLQPPPALTRIHSAPTKRSFRKPRTSGPSHVTMSANPPRVPSRSVQQNQNHTREPSTSEDDVSFSGKGSRRNSANDEQTGKGAVVPPPRRPFEGSEIQYLDLDLDSDSQSQSPRTPNEHNNHQRSGSTLSNKEFSTNNSQTQPTISSGSTVYKTVDFLKTEAFNKIRLNVETNRNSQ